ncbi:hypothetical protein DL771_005615 [Monosporascus sp. 5C6A]|nr:hypothetical protein DL771_005615 [Monosporascus sp. 5C6A]
MRRLPPPHTKPAEMWNFDLQRGDLQRDELNFSLSDEQCRIAFPDLYYELDRARDHLLKHNRGLTEEDVPGGQGRETYSWRHGEFHCMIYGGELYVIKEVKGDPDRWRGLAAFANMYRAPNPQHRDNPWLWVVPDFDGWAYPDDGVGGYVNFRDDVRDAEAKFKKGRHDMEAKLSWRGSLAVNAGLRQGLAAVAENKPWSDVEAIDWHNRSNVMAMTDFCRYQYVAHTEGNSWSGPFRYLQNCNCVPVIHKLEYVTHYYPLLNIAGFIRFNCAKGERGWSDPNETMEALLEDPQKSHRIAAESARIPGPVPDPGGRGQLLAEDIPQLEAGHGVLAQEYDRFENGTNVRRGVSWERFAFRQKHSFEHGFFEPDLQDENE